MTRKGGLKMERVEEKMLMISFFLELPRMALGLMQNRKMGNLAPRSFSEVGRA